MFRGPQRWVRRRLKTSRSMRWSCRKSSRGASRVESRRTALTKAGWSVTPTGEVSKNGDNPVILQLGSLPNSATARSKLSSLSPRFEPRPMYASVSTGELNHNHGVTSTRVRHDARFSSGQKTPWQLGGKITRANEVRGEPRKCFICIQYTNWRSAFQDQYLSAPQKLCS